MKTIRNWNELDEYGVSALTGEACAYGYRILCDLSYAGVSLVAECLGIERRAFERSLPSNWNSKVGAAEAQRSIMLSREMFTPLAIFALFKANCKQVFVMHDGPVHGVEETDSDEKVEQFVKWSQGAYCEECRRYGKGGGIMFQYRNPGFARNMHQMSGRTV